MARRLRSVRNHAVEDEALSYHESTLSTRKLIDNPLLAKLENIRILNLRKYESPSVIGLLWCDQSPF